MPLRTTGRIGVLAAAATLVVACGVGGGGGTAGTTADTTAQSQPGETEPLSAETQNTAASTTSPSIATTASTTETTATTASTPDTTATTDSIATTDAGSGPDTNSGGARAIPVGPTGCIGFQDMYDFPMDAIAIAPSDLPSWSVEGWYATVDREGLEFFVYNIDGAVIDQTDLPEGITVSSDGTISAEATIGPNAGKKLTLTFLVGESKVNSALAGHASPCNRGG